MASDQTTIMFTLPDPAHVVLKFANTNGEEVLSPMNMTLLAGNHKINVDTHSLKSGLYIYRLTAGNRTRTRKIVIMK